jgi:RNA polymerase sigma factor (sigma-70 family)
MAHLDDASPPAPDSLDLSADLQKKLKAFIHKRVLNPEDAEDIFQLTCLEAWRSQTRFNGQATLSTWMCGIAQNLIRNHFRRLYARPVHCEFDEMLCHEQDCSRDLYGQFETHRRLERTLVAINRLPSEMRDTLYASVHSGGSYRDTASAMEIPIGTVRSRISRAREQLKLATHG